MSTAVQRRANLAWPGHKGWHCGITLVFSPSFRSSLVGRRSSYVIRHASGGGEEVGTAGASWPDDVMRNS